MPIYEYRCTSCGADLEIFQHMEDPTLTVCPECKGKLKKVFSPVGIVFKGSGFYATDSKKSTSSMSTPAASSPTPAASTESPSSDASSAKSTPPASSSVPSTSTSTPTSSTSSTPAPASS